jgi:hypothetical protein
MSFQTKGESTEINADRRPENKEEIDIDREWKFFNDYVKIKIIGLSETVILDIKIIGLSETVILDNVPKEGIRKLKEGLARHLVWVLGRKKEE